MIYGIFHKGSGLGNQLHRYVATRLLAASKGVDFSMINPEGFKGADFLHIDMGKKNNIPFHVEEPSGRVVPDTDIPIWQEKKIIEDGIDIRSYDPEYNFVLDDVIIDGEFQDEKYWLGFDLRSLLVTEPIEMPKDICIIGFRGGEFYANKDLGLPKSYYEDAMKIMRAVNPDIKFEVHTDDPELAIKFFPDFKIIHDIEKNWKAIRYAKYLIISNSSFFIFPALMNENCRAIAPRGWARRNINKWAMPSNYYPKFIYI